MKKTVFLLGDSISLHYNPYLIEQTQDVYNWLTKAGRAEAMKNLDVPIDANGGSSRRVLDFLREEAARESLNYDYLLLNCGLHDIAIDAGMPTQRVDAGDYHKNLTDVLTLAAAHGIKVIWVMTTPVDDAIHNSRSTMRRYNRNVLLYNAIAKEVMKGKGIPVIDLYTFTAALEGEKYADHVHFTDSVRQRQANYIATRLQEITATY